MTGERDSGRVDVGERGEFDTPLEDGIEDNAYVIHSLGLVRRVVNRRAEEPIGKRVAGMIKCDDDVAPRRKTFAKHRVRRASPGPAM